MTSKLQSQSPSITFLIQTMEFGHLKGTIQSAKRFLLIKVAGPIIKPFRPWWHKKTSRSNQCTQSWLKRKPYQHRRALSESIIRVGHSITVNNYCSTNLRNMNKTLLMKQWIRSSISTRIRLTSSEHGQVQSRVSKHNSGTLQYLIWALHHLQMVTELNHAIMKILAKI